MVRLTAETLDTVKAAQKAAKMAEHLEMLTVDQLVFVKAMSWVQWKVGCLAGMMVQKKAVPLDFRMADGMVVQMVDRRALM